MAVDKWKRTASMYLLIFTSAHDVAPICVNDINYLILSSSRRRSSVFFVFRFIIN